MIELLLIKIESEEVVINSDICIHCEGVGDVLGEICYHCDGSGLSGGCNCHARCACECACGILDNAECHCYDM